MKILVTAGGTKEYIDGVRYIGNCSSGQTGADLVDYLSAQGHEVTWVGARSAFKPKNAWVNLRYETFDDLSNVLQDSLKNHAYDLVFQAAAVSDFSVSKVILDGKAHEAGRGVKLPTADEVQLILTKQPKLVSSIKQWSKNPHLQVVAFKLTNTLDAQLRSKAVNKLIQQTAIDWVAHNDLHEISKHSHAFSLYQNAEQPPMVCADYRALVDSVIKHLEVQS